jgi:hypothetical protein
MVYGRKYHVCVKNQAKISTNLRFHFPVSLGVHVLGKKQQTAIGIDLDAGLI